MFKAYEIKPDIHWVGVLEWNEREIHGITMPHGSTNNAYLIMDEHVTLIDTCTPGFEHELLERIACVVDPAKIDYIISQHGEKDHAGAVAKVAAVAKNAQIVTSDPKGAVILATYLGGTERLHPVKNGDELNIGKRTLTFVHTPMVHWPDNMVTYSPTDKLLFSNDGFGQFLATSFRFADQANQAKVLHHAKKYFANILTPFAKQTARAAAAVRALDLDMIAPAHGLIWRNESIPTILDAYDEWCALKPRNQAVVVYSTMYGSTERMAQTITEAFMAAGVRVRMFNLPISDISDIMAEVMTSKWVAVGSPTHNSTVLPEVGGFLTYLRGLAPKGRTGIAFGSYGWAKSATTEIENALKQAGFELPLEQFTADWNETASDEAPLFDAVKALVEQN